MYSENLIEINVRERKSKYTKSGWQWDITIKIEDSEEVILHTYIYKPAAAEVKALKTTVFNALKYYHGLIQLPTFNFKLKERKHGFQKGH